jgi:hypothetical protein
MKLPAVDRLVHTTPGTLDHNLISNAGSSKPSILLLPLPPPLAPPLAYHNRLATLYLSITSPTRRHSRLPYGSYSCRVAYTRVGFTSARNAWGALRRFLDMVALQLRGWGNVQIAAKPSARYDSVRAMPTGFWLSERRRGR